MYMKRRMHWLVHADIPHTAENQPGFSGPLFPLCNQLSVLDPSSYFRRIFGRRHNIKMSKVYIGNLSLEVTEKELRNLFEQKAGITAQEISMKDGFAFVDVENNDLVEQAIEKLNGKNFFRLCVMTIVYLFKSMTVIILLSFSSILM